MTSTAPAVPHSDWSNIPAAVGIGSYKPAPCAASKMLGKNICWQIESPIPYVSDGGGPADLQSNEKRIKKFAEIQKTLNPKLTYHPLAHPKKPGHVDIDPQTFDILSSTHKLLLSVNSSYATDCWLCLLQGTPLPLAIPYPFVTSTTNNSCNIALPFLVQPLGFNNTPCILSPTQNDTTEVNLGSLSFTNCSSFINVSSPMCAPNGSVYICGNNYAYTYLPQTWTGVCTLGSLLPDVSIIPGDEPVPILTFEHIAGRTKRAVHFIPLLAGLGITTALATGSAGIGHSLVQYHKLFWTTHIRCPGTLRNYPRSSRSG